MTLSPVTPPPIRPPTPSLSREEVSDRKSVGEGVGGRSCSVVLSGVDLLTCSGD